MNETITTLIQEINAKREIRAGWLLYRAHLLFPYLSQVEAAEAVAAGLSFEYPHISRMFQVAANHREPVCGRYSHIGAP